MLALLGLVPLLPAVGVVVILHACARVVGPFFSFYVLVNHAFFGLTVL